MTNLTQIVKDWQLATALYDAIEDANFREVAALVEEKHANPNIVLPDYSITPFHLAVGHENQPFSKEVTKLLLRNGADPNISTVDGVTPVHVAAAWNRAAVVRLLLSYGGDPTRLDDAEKNAFHYAHEEEAWETLHTLQIFQRTRHLQDQRNDPDKSYNIRLDRVVIHSNDVDAEYRASYDDCNEITKEKQDAATQTPHPRIRVSTPEDSLTDELNFYSKLDPRYDWCDLAQDVFITDECKRKILLHRSRTNMYEYTPSRKQNTSLLPNSTSDISKKRYFSPVTCCIDPGATKTVNKNDSKERKDFKSILEKQIGVPLVETNRKKFVDNSIQFSEESLMSDDVRSLVDDFSKLTAKEFSFSPNIDMPFIDESTSDCSRYYCTDKTNLDSRENENKIVTIENNVKLQDEVQTVATVAHEPREKHVSWSGCFRTCVCIPPKIDERDRESLSTYYVEQRANEENASRLVIDDDNLISDIDSTPETVKIGKNEEKRKEISRIGGNVSIECKYTDNEDGVEFIETRLPLSDSSPESDVVNCERVDRTRKTTGAEDSETDVAGYDTDYIRKELGKLGFISGPICGPPTKRLYLRKLKRIRKTISSPLSNLIKPSFSWELEQILKDEENWNETLAKWSVLESEMRTSFQNDDGSLSYWRMGTAKTSFTYLLLDPRTSDNLPSRCDRMAQIDVWRTFARSIFYIGKGTKARPYEHLHEALTVWSQTKAYARRRLNAKVKHILEIWNEGLGVVCVQAFHNCVPAEALTREAAMINAVGLARLKNEKCGVFYGAVASWNAKQKRRLGVYLLYRAMKIFVAENEIQLKPTDVK